MLVVMLLAASLLARPVFAQAAATPAQAESSAPPSPTFTGSRACQPCHAPQYAAWLGSHHDRAMQPANDAHRARRLRRRDVHVQTASPRRFLKKDGTFFVRTDGPDGTLARLSRSPTPSGSTPLQQYLIEFPDGRLQALSDLLGHAPQSRRRPALVLICIPDEKIDFRDRPPLDRPGTELELHVRRVPLDQRAQALRRADRALRHARGRRSTSRAKPATARARSTSRGRSQKAAGHAPDDPTEGLTVDLAAAAAPGRSRATHRSRTSAAHATRACRSSARRCHARRTQISEDDRPGPSRSGRHTSLSLLDERLYHADGQILDEVFEYGSFLQSRMHAARRRLHRLPRSAQRTAARRGQRAVRQVPSAVRITTRRRTITTRRAPPRRAACSCHMLARNYMVVHRRHDHSFRVPRPDLSVTLGTPNTCTDCHTDRGAAVGRRRGGAGGTARRARAGRALRAGAGRRPAAPGRRGPVARRRRSATVPSRRSSAPRR